jgi:S1-C subfamily serine protease
MLLLFSGGASGQEAPTPVAPRPAAQALPQTPPPQPDAARVVIIQQTTPAPSEAPVAVTTAFAQTPPTRRPSPRAATPPPQVVTVVHRLSGWKLLNWLAARGTPSLELDDLPSTEDVHTNIVAGYVSDDGRTVVARLPRAEVELESFPAPPQSLFLATPPTPAPPATAVKADSASEYTVVTSDGRHVGAKFVGLDSSTGLSLLEAVQPLLAGAPVGAEGDTEDPSVGQLVRLYAPVPAPKSAAVAGTAPAAQGGYIYLSIEEREARLTELKRAPSGRLFGVVARADVSPEWTGAVAANDAGEVVGIVSQSGAGETQIVPVETIRVARERVLKFGGSAPQPWLGARGDAAFRAPLQTWEGLGWKRELALPHIQGKRGVILTSVAPGTPAALAGLRPGDLIARVGAVDVRGVEDFSYSLKEAGVGSSVDFTVLRAFEQTPLKFSVQLKGAQNPALATAEAEERAARESLNSLRREIEGVRTQMQLASDAAAHARLTQQLEEAQRRLDKVRDQVEQAEARAVEANLYSFDDPDQTPVRPESLAMTAAALQTFGLNAVGLTARVASRLGASGGGLLVVAVRPDSPCAASGLRAGDVIETLDGAPFKPLDLQRLASSYEGKPVSLGVVRHGQRLTLTLSTAGDDLRQR